MKAQTFTTPFGSIEVTGREANIVELCTFTALYDTCLDKQAKTKDSGFKDMLDGIIEGYGKRIEELLLLLNTVE